MDSALVERLQRIYSALGGTVEGDMAKLPPVVLMTDNAVLVWQDFTGGLSVAQLTNLAYSLIHNIASLKDHARRVLKTAGIDPEKSEEIGNVSTLRIIADLSNNDKHGYPPRNGGNSGLSPHLGQVTRILRMVTGGEAGSVTALTFGPTGMVLSGDGTIEAIITADVLDAEESRIGDLHELCVEGLQLWENGLTGIGIL